MQRELQAEADRARDIAESIKNERSGQVRLLEQENLQLFEDLKTAKKQLQHVKSELSVLRAQVANTVASESARSPIPETKTNKPGKSTYSKRAPASTNKENSGNRLDSVPSSQKPKGSVSRRERRAPDLGEAFAATEEHTEQPIPPANRCDLGRQTTLGGGFS